MLSSQYRPKSLKGIFSHTAVDLCQDESWMKKGSKPIGLPTQAEEAACKRFSSVLLYRNFLLIH